jgi:hypothetical protein
MIKVKEIKDDAIIEVKVNKAYYLMLKNTLFYLFNSPDKTDKSLENIKTKKYEELTQFEQSFLTISLMLSEIESIVQNTNNFIEKDIEEETDK